MKPNIKLYIRTDGKEVYQANLTALNIDSVKMLCKMIDESIDKAATMEIPDDENQCYGKAIEYVEPSFSAYE